MSFRAGDYVKYRDPNGSIGKVIAVRGSRFDVEWVYGRDVRNVPMTAVSTLVRFEELVRISRAHYEHVFFRKGWAP